MSNVELKLAIETISQFIERENEDAKQNGTRQRCKNFFSVIHHLRIAMQVITELLRRVEALETEINNLKIE